MCHGAQVIEHSAKNLVRWEDALAALREFLATQRRPSHLEWETL